MFIFYWSPRTKASSFIRCKFWRSLTFICNRDASFRSYEWRWFFVSWWEWKLVYDLCRLTWCTKVGQYNSNIWNQSNSTVVLKIFNMTLLNKKTSIDERIHHLLISLFSRFLITLIFLVSKLGTFSRARPKKGFSWDHTFRARVAYFLVPHLGPFWAHFGRQLGSKKRIKNRSWFYTFSDALFGHFLIQFPYHFGMF